MAGSSHTTTKGKISMGGGSYPNYITTVTGTWTADDADGSIPSASVDMNGWVIKVVTNPGSTAPTDNYDITVGDPNDTSLDALASQLKDRDSANTEQVYPIATNGVTPILLGGTYTIAITGNSVNSATGTYTFYIKDIL